MGAPLLEADFLEAAFDSRDDCIAAVDALRELSVIDKAALPVSHDGGIWFLQFAIPPAVVEMLMSSAPRAGLPVHLL